MSSSSRKMLQAAAGNAGGGSFYPYTIDNSARFVGSDNAYLSKTFSTTPDSRTTCTISVWVKLTGKGNGYNANFLWGTGGNWDAALFVEPTNTNGWRANQIRVTGMTSTQPTLRTTSVYRDYSGWFNFITVWDSSNATAADRQRLYINGVRLTDFDQQVTASLNQQLVEWLSTTGATNIGISGGSTVQSFDGYMADFVCLDGTAASPTDLGEDKNGVWVPKNPSGLTFGTNGFWLDFADSANLGNDVSGNNNNFTSSGLTSSDQMLDTPTNNFATWNPLDKSNSPTIAEGNLKVTGPATGVHNNIRATMSMSTGKWYWEVTITTQSGYHPQIGIYGTSSVMSGIYISDRSDGYIIVTGNNGGYNGKPIHAGTVLSSLTTFTNGDIVNVAYDADNGKLYWGKNGTWLNSADPAAGTGAVYSGITGEYSPAMSVQSSDVSEINFGQSGFAYTPPTDFLALSTANLPEPAIGPNSATQSDENFNTVLYTGTGSARTVTGVGFQPDWLWIKKRSAAENHALYDVLRGPTKRLESNNTNVEDAETGGVSSFDSDGFSISGASDRSNTSGATYVAWNWKANGSGVTNTDGSITSTVSANTNAGISIVTYTGSGSTGQETIGVGLNWSGKNKVVITKNRDDATFNWGVNSNILASNKVLTLNTTNDDSQENSSHYITYETNGFRTYNGGSQILNLLGDSYIAYCFAEVEGFSKIGSYTGNGSTDGPFVYTGFRPAFVLIKSSSLAQSWVLKDTARFTSNVTKGYLLADTSAAEVTDHSPTYTDILSNGFKLKGSANATNASGGSYIYMAFAENPFKYSTAR
jgi:hypothetical protein